VLAKGYAKWPKPATRQQVAVAEGSPPFLGAVRAVPGRTVEGKQTNSTIMGKFPK